MKAGDWVKFEGAGEVLEVYDDPYHQGTEYKHEGVAIRVKLSNRPHDDFIVRLPAVCVEVVR